MAILILSLPNGTKEEGTNNLEHRGFITVTERDSERLRMKCTFSVIVSFNLSTSIFGIG